MDMPLVSIIIPAYNRAQMLSRAIDSIIKQTYQHWELIVVDDASTDNTFDILKAYKQKDHRISYIKLEKNSGACIARNVGIKNANGEYITFLDSDDEYVPEKIEKQVELFRSSIVPNLGVVSCGHIDERNGVVYSKWLPKKNGNILKNILSKERVGARTPLMMVRKSLIIENQIFFDPRLPSSEEWDFLLRLCQHANFDFVPEPLLIVHHHSNERVYNPTRALTAIEMQYEKNKGLLMENKDVHDSFVLKMVEQNYIYGFPGKASEILQSKILQRNYKVFFWKTMIGAFPRYGTMPSKVAYKLLKSLVK